MNGALVDYHFDSDNNFNSGQDDTLSLGSGCTVPGDGVLGQFTSGKTIPSTAAGWVNLRTGDFYINVHAAGDVGVQVGELKVAASSLSVVVQRGVTSLAPPSAMGSGSLVSPGEDITALEEGSISDNAAEDDDTEHKGNTVDVRVVADGVLTLPQGMGSAVVTMSLDMGESGIRIRAQGEGTILNTAASVVFGAAVKHNGTAADTRPQVYAVATMVGGLELAGLPQFEGVPGLEVVPVLGQGAMVATAPSEGL